MRVTLNSIRLQQALATVAASTAPRSSLVALSCVLLDADGDGLTLSGTDLDTASIVRIEAEVEEPGRILVSAERLGAIAQRLPAAETALRLKDHTTLALTSGRMRMELRGMDYKEFPMLPTVPDEPLFTLLGRDIGIINNRVAFCVADAKDSREGMKGVGIFFAQDEVRAVATSGLQLSELILQREDASPAEEMLLHHSVLDRAEKMFGGEQPVRFARSGNHIALRGDGRTFICRLMGEKFPNYAVVVSSVRRDIDRWMECDRNVLTSIIQRMQVVAGAVDISPVRLTLTGDRLLCYTASPDAGEAEEEVEVDHDGGAASVVLNTRRMLEVMRRVPGARIRMELTDDPNRAVFFLPGDAESESMKNTLLLMPVRQDAPQVAGWKPVAST